MLHNLQLTQPSTAGIFVSSSSRISLSLVNHTLGDEVPRTHPADLPDDDGAVEAFANCPCFGYR